MDRTFASAGARLRIFLWSLCVLAAGAGRAEDAQAIVTVAGKSTFIGDGLPGPAALLSMPKGIALDAAGNLYIAEQAGNRVRKVSGGIITTVVGNPWFLPRFTGDIGDGLPATAAMLNSPRGLQFDAAGNLYIGDNGTGRVRVVNLSAADVTVGSMTVHAGNIATCAGIAGAYSGPHPPIGDGGPASAAKLAPAGLSFDGAGNLYVVDAQVRIRRVDGATGIITTVVGNGTAGSSGDGGPATSAAITARIVTADAAGNLYISDNGHNVVRFVNRSGADITIGGQTVHSGNIATIVGTGTAGYSGDGGPAGAARLNGPDGVRLDGAGNLFIADNVNGRVRRVDAATWNISTVAGTGVTVFNGDGREATTATLDSPTNFVFDTAANLYVTETSSNRPAIRKIAAGTDGTVNGNGDGEIISTAAGGGTVPPLDGGPATLANLLSPRFVAGDAAGNLYFADSASNRVRRIDAAAGTITTVAGNGTLSYGGPFLPFGNGGPAISALLSAPFGVAIDGPGNLLIADTGDNAVRNVAGGNISAFAGTGAAGFSGDGGAAVLAKLDAPRGMVIDGPGNLYVADSNNNCVRKIAAGSGTVTTAAGRGTNGAGDTLNAPRGLALYGSKLYIADINDNRVQQVDLALGVVNTVAGTGVAGYAGDGGLATAAKLSQPSSVAVDGAGNLYIAENANAVVRFVNRTGADVSVGGQTVHPGNIATVAGTGLQGFSGDGGAPTAAKLNSTLAVFVDSGGNVLISDAGNHRIRRLNVAARINLSPFDAGNVAARIEFGSHDVHSIDLSSITIQAIDPTTHDVASAQLGIGDQPAGYPFSGDVDGNGIADVTVVLPMPPVPFYPAELRVQGRLASGIYFSADLNFASVCAIDTTPPVLAAAACHDGATLECSGSSSALVPKPGATDDCDPHPTVSCSPPAAPVGATTQVTCAAQDRTALPANVSASCAFNVTVVDTTRPTVSCPADIVAQNDPGACSARLDPGSATASDTCDPSPAASGTRSDGKSLGDPYPANATTAITWIATDASGNVSDPCTQTITVQDTEPPTVQFAAASPSANSYGWNNTSVTLPFVVGDNCAGPLDASVTSPATCSAAGGSLVLSAEGAAVNCSIEATDAAGNSATFTSPAFKIDKTPPAIAAASVSPSMLWPPNHKMRPVALAISVRDNLALAGNPVQSIAIVSNQVDGTVSVEPAAFVFTDAVSGSSTTMLSLRAERAGGDPGGRRYDVHVTVSDAAGNTASVVRTVWVPHDQSAMNQ